MAHRDLTKTIPLVREELTEHGADTSLSNVLDAMGISLPRVIEEPGPTRPMAPPNLADVPAGEPRNAMPSRLGRLQALGELGRGGMGVVLEARDPELRRVVAVKLVGNPKSITNAQLARFVAEAQITSQLQHPNIVPVHDLGYTDDGEIYFTMKKICRALAQQRRHFRESVRTFRAVFGPNRPLWRRRIERARESPEPSAGASTPKLRRPPLSRDGRRHGQRFGVSERGRGSLTQPVRALSRMTLSALTLDAFLNASSSSCAPTFA